MKELTADSKRQAINRHGVFLKKAVLATINKLESVRVFQEEFPVCFGETAVADIIAFTPDKSPPWMFVLECKRAYAAEKTWIFFRDHDPCFRICRKAGIAGSGTYLCESPPTAQFHVCSEGVELREKDRNKDGKHRTVFEATPQPIYSAGNQLSRSYLGFVQERVQALARKSDNPGPESILPILVTTARLQVCDFAPDDVSLQTGNLTSGERFADAHWLILKHPFAMQEETVPRDFRTSPTSKNDFDHWRMARRESLYVVHAQHLATFLEQEVWMPKS